MYGLQRRSTRGTGNAIKPCALTNGFELGMLTEGLIALVDGLLHLLRGPSHDHYL